MAGPHTSPLGRIVQGDPYRMSPALDNKNQPKLGKNGQPFNQCYIGLAIPKNDSEWPSYKSQMDAEDRSAWPTLFDAQGNCLRADFATKIVDGDSTQMNKNNVRPCDCEGFKGHWIVKFGSTYAPKVKVARNGVWVDSPGGDVKCGDWVRISGSFVSNQSQQTPGMHRNPEQIALYRQDTEIVTASAGPSADERFGAPPPSPTASPSSPPPPPYDGYMGAPPPPAGPTMLPAAKGITYEQYQASGWTDKQLVDAGMMAA